MRWGEGNRLRQVNRALPTDTAPLSTDTYSYTAGTNRLASVKTGTGAAAPIRTIQYDARGNTAAETRPGGVSVTTAYDGYGRLTQYTRGTEALSFQYNGRDDRVAMTSASAGVRRFVYDPAGRVIGEYGLSAADVKAEFIWLSPEVANDNAFGGDDGIGGYAPLAVATPDSSGIVQLNWVHPNHLGVPLVTTDASGNPATTPNDFLAPGFPGQARVLADLYYNRYRDYDPTTGRYIQADPIGLAGGGNPYLYAGGNPVTGVDPLGLRKINLFDWRHNWSIWWAAENSPDVPGVCVVFGHGNQSIMETPDGVKDGTAMAGYLRAQGCKDAEPVILQSCDTGGSSNGFAQDLANERFRLSQRRYRLPVIAPNTRIWFEGGVFGSGLIGPIYPKTIPGTNQVLRKDSREFMSDKAGKYVTFYPQP